MDHDESEVRANLQFIFIEEKSQDGRYTMVEKLFSKAVIKFNVSKPSSRPFKMTLRSTRLQEKAIP